MQPCTICFGAGCDDALRQLFKPNKPNQYKNEYNKNLICLIFCDMTIDWLVQLIYNGLTAWKTIKSRNKYRVVTIQIGPTLH